MNPQHQVPLFAALALAAAASGLTAFALGRRHQPGWAWWVAATWGVTLGLLLGAWLHPPFGRIGRALAAPLLLQWPLVALIGLRHFFGRKPWAGSVHADLLLLVVACAFAALGPLLLAPEHHWLLGLCGLAVHLYAAGVLFLAPLPAEGDGATPVYALGAAMALVAFTPGLARLSAFTAVDTEVLRALAAAFGALVLVLVTFVLSAQRSEGQLRDAQRRLRTLATLDTLTQVPNRHHFNELATQALQADASGSATLLLFDIDHFKQINEHLGSAAGDRALRLVSASVLEHLRAADIAGRHGSDEFVLLLRRASTPHAMRVAARIVADVQENAPGMQLPLLTLSFGVVQVHAGEDVEAALRRADLALLEAKRQGRSCAVAASGDEHEPVFSASQPLGLTAA
jgi:diguanylate cyclase (GGDEF)-like protein